MERALYGGKNRQVKSSKDDRWPRTHQKIRPLYACQTKIVDKEVKSAQDDRWPIRKHNCKSREV
jgi:hypothetical protein